MSVLPMWENNNGELSAEHSTRNATNVISNAVSTQDSESSQMFEEPDLGQIAGTTEITQDSSQSNVVAAEITKETPTKPPSKLLALFEQTLFKKNGNEAKGLDVLKDKIVMLYFTALWSPPCMEFTPLLVNFYQELTLKGAPLDIVFFSCDDNKEEMRTYFTTMHGDWWAVPFGSTLITDIRTLYNVRFVPKLLVLKENGDIICKQGRKDVTDKGISAFKTWCEASTIKLASEFNMFDTEVDEDEKKLPDDHKQGKQ